MRAAASVAARRISKTLMKSPHFHRLVFPQSEFLTVYRALREAARAGNPSSSLRRLGLSARSEGLDLSLRPGEPDNASPLLEIAVHRRLTDFQPSPSPRCVATLALGLDKELGQAIGLIRMDGSPASIKPISELHLVGPGMERIALRAAPKPPAINEELWSRTRGARGEEPWRAGIRLRPAIIGCGRTGSALASMLSRSGTRKMVLIDGDTIEPSNVGEMSLVGASAVGRPKVEAVADEIARLGLGTRVIPVPHSVTSFAALNAIRESDYLVTCTDHDGARMAAAALSTTLLKPHLDVGITIRRTANSSREMGCDIRLTWPTERCLMCAGSLNDTEAAKHVLESAETERLLRETPRAWQTETRAGSLGALNAMSCGFAVTLLECYADGLLTRNGLWVRVEFSARGLPSLRQLTVPRPANCPVCALAGAGEAGLEQARELWAGGQTDGLAQPSASAAAR